MFYSPAGLRRHHPARRGENRKRLRASFGTDPRRRLIVTHEQMLQYEKYARGSAGSQAIALEVADFVQQRFGLVPRATANGFLLYEDNVLLIETIHQTDTSVTLNV